MAHRNLANKGKNCQENTANQKTNNGARSRPKSESGGGGNRTHVRKPSTAEPTCISGFSVIQRGQANRQINPRMFLSLFLSEPLKEQAC